MISTIARLVAALALLCAAGCFKTPTPDCAFLGGAGGSCPDNYFCAGDGVCKRDGLPDTLDCGFTAPPDAGPPVDAPPGIDASADAGADAAVSGSGS